MTIKTALRTLTLQGPGIAAAFGSRLHWDYIPDGVTYPCIKAQVITDPPNRTHHGTFGGRALVQLDIYDDDQLTCDTSAELVKAWLDNYNGQMGSNRVTIQVRNDRSMFEDAARLYRRMFEIEILYMT